MKHPFPRGLALLSGGRRHVLSLALILGAGSGFAASLQGTVVGGGQPLTGASVLVYQAGLNPGDAPRQIAATTTAANGAWSVETLNPAPATGQLLYVVALGGRAAGSTANPSTALMTLAGPWGRPAFQGTLTLNELSTVASTAQMQGYIRMVPCADIAGSTTRGQTTANCPSLSGTLGMAGHALTLGNLINPATGSAARFLTGGPEGSALNTTLRKLNLQASVMADCIARDTTACNAYFGVAGAPDAGPASFQPIAGSPMLGNSPIKPLAIQIHPNGKYAYVLNYASILPCLINPVTGALSPIGDPVAAGVGPNALKITANGNYAYVASVEGNAIYGYAINAQTGALTPLPQSPFKLAVPPFSLALSKDDQYLYTGTGLYGRQPDGGWGSAISVLQVAANGALTLQTGTPAYAPGSVSSLALSPDGKSLYATGYRPFNTVSAFTINPGTGRLSPTGPAQATGRNPWSVAVSPDGRFAYVANSSSDSLSTYAISPQNGALTPGKPLATGISPVAVAIAPDGSAVYVAGSGNKSNNFSGTVSVFAVNADNGGLTPRTGSPFKAGQYTNGVTVTQEGRFVYAANYWAENISGFRTTPAAGNTLEAAFNLARQASSGTGSGAALFALAPQRPLYTPLPAAAPGDWAVGNAQRAYLFSAAGQAEAYRIDAQSGTLSPVAGSQFNLGHPANYLTSTPDGRFIYAWDNERQMLRAYSIAPGSGILTAVSPTSHSSGPTPSLRVSPDGRFLYASAGNNSVTTLAYAINADSGALASPVTALASSSGTNVSFSPDGRFAYCVLGNAIQQCSINTTTGVLTPVTPAQTITTGLAPVFTPNGQLAYVYDGFDVVFRIFTVNASTGALSPSGNPMPARVGPNNAKLSAFMSFSPDSRYAFLTANNGRIVASYQVNLTTGQLTLQAPLVNTTNLPQSLMVTADGRFAYESDSNNAAVVSYSISNQGGLTAINTATPPSSSRPVLLTP